MKTTRCSWAETSEDFFEYHDTEWARAAFDDQSVFERLCLESFQSGLSWRTILNKRDGFRKAFSNFSVDKVARFTEAKVNKLLDDLSIVRHRGKIEATINNAKHSKALIKEFGSLDQYFRQMLPAKKEKVYGAGETLTSKAISKDLKKRGFKFLGPTTVYSFMQAQGYVNDHEKSCFVYDEVEKLRLKSD